jgi:hypothetical protein
MDAVKLLIFEWVITNGSLPGFAERLDATKPLWKTVEADMTVYRGQGHSKKGIPMVGAVPPNLLKGDIRPIISTSKERASVIEYAGADCCIFQIVLKPGVKYLDIEPMFTSTSPSTGERYIYVAPEIVDGLKARVPNTPEYANYWIKPRTPSGALIQFFKRNIQKEHEVMVLGGGVFVEPVSLKGAKPEVLITSYSPKAAGRRVQTFRRKPKSRSNGRGPARKPATRRYRKS